MIGGLIAGAILIAVIAIGAFVAYKQSKNKTKQAIKTVAEAFKDCNGYVYTDYKVMIDGDENRVDLVYVGPAGLIVAKVIIETGKIYGDNLSNEWKRIDGNKEEHFKSPVRDREKLVNILRHAVPTDYQIYSCVVFMNADIKEVRCTNVLTYDGLKQYIADRPKALSQNKIDEIKQVLDKYKKSVK